MALNSSGKATARLQPKVYANQTPFSDTFGVPTSLPRRAP
jgi:hypothetical protein